MTIHRLLEILRLISDLDTELRLQKGIDSIKLCLTNLVANPAAADQQMALAAALKDFDGSVGSLNRLITPSQSLAIAELGGSTFFEPTMADKIQASVSANGMTPSVALDYVKDLATRRAAFLATSKQTQQGLEALGITVGAPAAGAADLAFLIPRNIFDNELGRFAKELRFISRLIAHYSEAVTGTPQAAQLEGLSSSDPTIGVVALIGVISIIGDVINKFLDAWTKIEKIRNAKANLEELGLKGVALDQLEEQIETNMTEVVEESTKLVMRDYRGTRTNELENGVRADTRILFGQIERGLVIQFRAEPDQNADEETQKQLENVATISKTISFPEIKGKPMLLTDGEVLGDLEVQHITTKTTTTRTASKKAVAKSIKESTSAD